MTKSAKLDLIYLDIDDTLFATTDFVSNARRDALQAMIDRGLEADIDFLMDELEKVVVEFGSNHDHHYDFLLKRLPLEMLAGVNAELLIVAGVIAYHNAKWRHLRISDEDSQLLADIHKAGVTLGVLSSGLVRKQMEKLLRLGVDKWLNPKLVFITHGVGMSKSNPEFYKQAIERSGYSASRIMHVGDHPFHDVDMANAVGMISVWVKGGGKHSANDPQSNPNHTVKRLSDLRELLREQYLLDV